MRPAPTPLRAAALPAVATAVIALNLVAVWSVDYLPTQDGPQHIYTLHAASRLDAPELGYGRFLRASLPVTNHGFAAVYAPFDGWLDWRDATRAALTVLVLVWCGGALALTRVLHARRGWLGIALAGVAFQWSLYMGFFSFHLASGFGLAVLAFALARPEPRPRDRVLLGALLLLLALLHVQPAIVVGLAVLALAVVRRERGERLGEMLRTALVGAPAAGVALATLAGAGHLDALQRAGSEAAYAPYWPGAWIVGSCFAAGPAWRAWAPVVLALAAGLAVCAGAARRAEDRTLVAVGAFGVFAAVAAPLHAPGWEFASVRSLPLALAAAVAALPLERIRVPARAGFAAGALALLALASAGWALGYNRALAARAAPALAGLEAGLQRDGARLGAILDPLAGRPLDDRVAAVPFAVPLLNLGQLYAAEQGGFPDHTFALSPTVHYALVREDAAARVPAAPDRAFSHTLAQDDAGPGSEKRRKLTAWVATHAAEFDDVVLYGAPEDADQLLARGFVADWRRGGLLLARYEGCPVRLAIAGTEARLSGGAEVELGWYPLLETARRYRIPGEVLRAGAALPLPGAPCGAVWIRVRAADGATCRGADAAGRLVFPRTMATEALRCELASTSHTAARR